MPAQSSIQDSINRAIRSRQVAQAVLDGLVEMKMLNDSLRNGDFDFGSIDFSNTIRLGNTDAGRLEQGLRAADNILQGGDGNALRSIAARQV